MTERKMETQTVLKYRSDVYFTDDRASMVFVLSEIGREDLIGNAIGLYIKINSNGDALAIWAIHSINGMARLIFEQEG